MKFEALADGKISRTVFGKKSMHPREVDEKDFLHLMKYKIYDRSCVYAARAHVR